MMRPVRFVIERVALAEPAASELVETRLAESEASGAGGEMALSGPAVHVGRVKECEI